MKLWLLQPRKNLSPELGNPWEPWYNKAHGFVVRAESERDARVAAHAQGGEENEGAMRAGKSLLHTEQIVASPWLNDHYSSCEELTLAGVAGVILRDFSLA